MRDADLLVIGAGIAGASAAWFARQAGLRTLVIDAGIARASDVPTALINPVRGYQGRLLKRGPEGARLTFALIDQLYTAGHTFAAGRGLWRPVPDAATRDTWAERLPSDYPHRWHAGAPAFLGLRGDAEAWHATLELPESGWVDGPAFVAALLAASGAQRMTARVTAIDPQAHRITLDDGQTLGAQHLLWCGGAWGAHALGVTAHYRPGSIVRTRHALGGHAVSHGLYAAPCGAGSALGPTREPSSDRYEESGDEGGNESGEERGAAAAVATMLQRAARMFATPFEPASVWRGVRLARVSLPAGLHGLGPYGARGFLMAPLEAREHARRHWGQRT